MPEDITSLKRKYESIYVPAEVDLVIEKAIRRSKQAKQASYFYKPLVAVASVLVLLMLTVNISPAISGYLGKLPGLSALIPIITFNPGNNGGHVAGGKSVTDNGVTLTVLGASYNGKTMSLNYELDYTGYRGHVKVMELTLRQQDGTMLSFSGSSGMVGNRGWTEMEFNSTYIPEDMVLQISRLVQVDGIHESIIHGDWSIPLTLNMQSAPRHVAIQKDVEVAGFSFSLDYLDIVADYLSQNPYMIEFSFTLDEDNSLDFSRFLNPRLVDQEDNKYPVKDWVGSLNDNQYRLLFQGEHMPNIEKLSFTADGICSPLPENYFLVFDVNSRQVIDSYGFEVAYLRTQEQIYDKIFWFEVNSLTNDLVPIGFLELGYDLTGNVFEVRTGIRDGELGLILDKFNLPEVLKVSFEGYLKKINEPIKVHLS